MKRCIFLYKERPHITAVPILLKESSSNVMSLASLATEFRYPSKVPLAHVQRRSIIRAVTRHSHYRTFLLQQLHQTLFVCGACTRHYLQVHHTVQCLLIRQFGKCSSRNAVLFRILRFPQTNLACYLVAVPGVLSRHQSSLRYLPTGIWQRPQAHPGG